MSRSFPRKRERTDRASIPVDRASISYVQKTPTARRSILRRVLRPAKNVGRGYLAPVVVLGTSTFTGEVFEPRLPVANSTPVPTTITINAPTRIPRRPVPPLSSVMLILRPRRARNAQARRLVPRWLAPAPWRRVPLPDACENCY